jgi:hypothetical protein
MSAQNIWRLVNSALEFGYRLSTGNTLKVLPKSDDDGAIEIGDGTTDVDVKAFLGSTTEYVELDVGNSRINATVPFKFNGGVVTQITSPTTGVTLSALSGQITTIAGTLAAAGEETFTVTNTLVDATDTVIVSLASNAGDGTPIAVCSAVAAGSFGITVANLHATEALTTLVVVNFVVIKGSAS